MNEENKNLLHIEENIISAVFLSSPRKYKQSEAVILTASLASPGLSQL